MKRADSGRRRSFRRWAAAVVVAAGVGSATAACSSGDTPASAPSSTTTAAGRSFTVDSTVLAHGVAAAQVANQLGCHGSNRSPDVAWTGLPSEAKSVAVTLWDRDAPTGSGLWHWIAFDIPTSTPSLSEGADVTSVGGRQAVNDMGATGYLGPCPTPGSGAHRYVLTVYALDTAKLNVPDQQQNVITRLLIHRHAIAEGTFEFSYSPQ